MRLFIQSGRNPTREPAEGEVWILLENTWNDFSYRTLYSLHRQTVGGQQKIGFIKILRRGQVEVETPLPVGELTGGRLPDDYISRGNSLDYYVSLAELGDAPAREMLRDLRDIAMDPALRETFAEEPGLRISLHRDEVDPEAFYEDARAIVEAGGPLPEEHSFSFEFAPGVHAEVITFEFKAPEVKKLGAPQVGPSRRMVVLVGANGVGKTQLLARLARVAYTPPAERDAVTNCGRFVGTPAFPSIVAVAYSAFDTFRPPDLQGDSPAAVAEQLRAGTGRYAYCGTRDLATSFLNPDEPVKLLTAQAQAELFADRIEQVRSSERLKLLAQALDPIFREDSFLRILPEESGADVQPAERAVARLETFLGGDPAQAFLKLSSGHMIVVHVLASLTATLRRRGLALIDEPETHLHPPLLAALMTGARRVIERLGAYAIIATHSPVVVQEVLASQVKIIEYGEGGPLVRPATVQTFGENTGTLTREIFGLHTGATDYRHVLDQMVQALGSVEELQAELGEPLSSQALAHVIAAFARRDSAVG